MMRNIFIFAVILATTTDLADAELVKFTISGTLPAGSSNHSMVADGEKFVATFLVEDSTPDSIDGGFPGDDEFGLYLDAVVGRVVAFSGGYDSEPSFESLDAAVFDELNIDGFDHDSVVVGSPNQDLRFQVCNFDDPAALPSDELPAIGTILVSAPDVLPINSSLAGMDFADEFGSIEFGLENSNENVLAVTTFNPGDINLDGNVNLLDIQPFVDLISSERFLFEADTNLDGSVDLLDVSGFVAVLTR